MSAYENGSLGRGGKFGSGCGGWSHISEALANLHEAIVRSRVPGSTGTEGGTPELSMRDAEVAHSVGVWLEQSGLLNKYGH